MRLDNLSNYELGQLALVLGRTLKLEQLTAMQKEIPAVLAKAEMFSGKEVDGIPREMAEMVWTEWGDPAQPRKIQAIKKLREITGWGLKEAKEWCDRNPPQ